MKIQIQDFNPLTGFSMGAIIIAMSIVFPNDEELNSRTILIVLGIITIVVTIIFMLLKQKENK